MCREEVSRWTLSPLRVPLCCGSLQRWVLGARLQGCGPEQGMALSVSIASFHPVGDGGSAPGCRAAECSAPHTGQVR